LKIRPNACRHLKNLCKLGLRLKFGLRTKSDLFYQVTQCICTVFAYTQMCVKNDGMALFLSLSFGVTHALFACQRLGLPHRLAQCVTPVVLRDTIRLN